MAARRNSQKWLFVSLALAGFFVGSVTACTQTTRPVGTNIQPKNHEAQEKARREAELKKASSPADFLLADVYAAATFGHNVFSQACAFAIDDGSSKNSETRSVCQTSILRSLGDLILDHLNPADHHFSPTVVGESLQPSTITLQQDSQGQILSAAITVPDQTRQNCSQAGQCTVPAVRIEREKDILTLKFPDTRIFDDSSNWRKLANKPVTCRFVMNLGQRVEQMACDGDMGRDYSGNRSVVFSEMKYQKNADPVLSYKALRFENGKAICGGEESCQPETFSAPKDQKYVIVYRNLEEMAANQARSLLAPTPTPGLGSGSVHPLRGTTGLRSFPAVPGSTSAPEDSEDPSQI